MDLTNAVEILDGSTGRWWYGIKEGSVRIDQESQLVSFIVRWKRTGGESRVTLGLEQIRGVRERAA
jgi:hypothetical protein